MQHARILLAVGISVLLAVGCGEPPPSDGPVATPELVVELRTRGSIQTVGQDTLSESVRVIGLEPEPSGESVAVLFADSGRRISAGLALAGDRSGPAPLLWPDSVTRAWWSGDHRLSFTTSTGDGVYVVVDVHDPAAAAVHRLEQVPAEAPDSTDPVLLGRAQGYIDSIRVQPTGVTTRGSMTYTVGELLVDPSGRLGAFRSFARDTVGRELNPAWYVMHLPSGTVALIDEIIGEASELPRAAGGWTADGRFIFAKGEFIQEASVRSSAAP